jgi:hypothetical protein
MTDVHDLSDGPDLAVTETLEKAAQKHKAAEDQALSSRRPRSNKVIASTVICVSRAFETRRLTGISASPV